MTPRGAGPALDWAEDAACRGRDVSEFFTTDRRRIRQIKNLCGRCQVREKCLAEALRAENSSRYGIFGGLTPAERTELAGGR